ncbi:MAG: SMC-Scp complex subunit ScpB [Clostridia bacterium]
MLTDIIEALIFASGTGLKADALYDGLTAHTKQEIDQALAELKKRHSGGRGIHLIEFNSTYQFQSNPIYGDTLADVLVETRERELSKTLLQVVAIIAYKQPITRQEIEDLRGVNSDYVIAMLLKLNLIEPKGRKETVGYPILYGTTDEFLKKFGLETITELPDYEELMHKIRTNYEKYYAKSSALFGEIEKVTPEAEVAAADLPDDALDDEETLPDFLQDEDFIIIE